MNQQKHLYFFLLYKASLKTIPFKKIVSKHSEWCVCEQPRYYVWLKWTEFLSKICQLIYIIDLIHKILHKILSHAESMKKPYFRNFTSEVISWVLNGNISDAQYWLSSFEFSIQREMGAILNSLRVKVWEICDGKQCCDPGFLKRTFKIVFLKLLELLQFQFPVILS